MTQLEAPVAAKDADPLPNHARLAIVGAGFSGLALGMRLLEEGIDDFVILERSTDVGGTWRDNTYPGCACDVPSALYSFSFAPNPSWGRLYAPQAEIQDYARRVARGHGLPLLALEPRARPRRPARRGARDRRLGRPVRARDPAAGRAADGLPAH